MSGLKLMGQGLRLTTGLVDGPAAGFGPCIVFAAFVVIYYLGLGLRARCIAAHAHRVTGADAQRGQ